MSDLMAERFRGISRLYGRAAVERFHRTRVAVIGLGGVGSWAVESLARSGIGHLTLVDLDEICISNVNRQLHAMDGQIGRLKTEAMAERARAISPAARVTVVPRFFNEASAAEILDAGFDAVIDAIDSTPHKALLLACCRERGILTVTCGGAGGRRDPTRIRVADLAHSGKDPLLHQLRRALRREHGFPKTPMGRKPEPLGIDAVFSDEAPVLMTCEADAADGSHEAAGRGLGCAGGLGSVTHVTAVFGMVAAGRVLDRVTAG